METLNLLVMQNSSRFNNALQLKVRNIITTFLIAKKLKKSDFYHAMGVSHSTFYKKHSGKTQFSIGDLAVISKLTNYSIDSFLNESHHVVPFDISGVTIAHNKASYLGLLHNLLDSLDDLEDPEIKFVTREIPVFYFFSNPLLGAFKLFIYSKVNWQLPFYKDKLSFSIDLVSDYEIKLMQDAWKRYTQIPSTELWSPFIWQMTLEQVKYMLTHDMFKNAKDALKIIKAIREITLSSRQWCEQGKKPSNSTKPGANFTVFNNNIINTNSFMLAGNEDNNKLLITHTNPNFLECDSEIIAKKTDQWRKNLQQSTIKLKGKGNTDAADYFSKLFREINEAEAYALNYIKGNNK